MGQQIVSPLQYGIFTHWSANRHTANFSDIPGFVERKTPTNGEGAGFAFGALINAPLTPKFRLSLRAGYYALDADLETNQSLAVILPTSDSSSTQVPGTALQSLATTIRTIEIEPLISYSPLERFEILGGLRAGVVISNNVVQREAITQPSGAEFLEGVEERILAEGSIPGDPGFSASFVSGLRYSLPLNVQHSLSLAPEIMYSAPITSLWDQGNWSQSSFRAGISVLFSPVTTIPVIYDTVRTIDTTVRETAGIDRERYVSDTTVQVTTRRAFSDHILEQTELAITYIRQIPAITPILQAEVSTIFVLDNGSETPAAKVTMEEFIENRHLPILPYIFFQPNSSVIEPRYTQLERMETTDFSIESLSASEPITVYHNILNIIGKRLHNEPRAILNLVGCNANIDSERGNTDLSTRRAIEIRTYLKYIWKIEGHRIRITTRNLPEKPSPKNTLEGIAENRRVEMSSNRNEIFAPVLLSDTLRTVDPPTIRFRTDAYSEVGFASWKLKITQGNTVLKEFGGQGKPQAVTDWEIQKENTRPLASKPIEYQLSVTDVEGQTRTSPVYRILFEQKTLRRKRRERIGDKVIDRYSLLLFDFGSDKISGNNTDVIKFIQSRLTPKSKILVSGSSDRIGDAEVNRLLSIKRAQSTARALGVTGVEIRGIGEDETTFNNEEPEGRFYSRTVRIRVETPIEYVVGGNDE